MQEVREELIPKGKVLKNQNEDWIKYFFDKKGRISEIILYEKSKYVTIKIKRTKRMISIKIQYPNKQVIFNKALNPNARRIGEQINAPEIFYVDFLETYTVENGIPLFVKYVMDYIQGWINEIFSPFQTQASENIVTQ